MKSYLFRYLKNGSIESFSCIAPTAISAIATLNASVGLVDIRYLKSSPRRVL